MATTPMQIINRPFSVEPLTGVMLPDGIFDSAIFEQEITCFYTNRGTTELSDVSIYLEGISAPNIVATPRSYHFDRIPAGGSVRLAWRADLRNAAPGKRNVSIIAQAAGFDLVRAIKTIFITRTTYDEATNTYRCELPEGSMRVDIQAAIAAERDCEDEKARQRLPELWLPTKMSMQVVPNPPYEGQFGDLPFQDPWWKVVAIIVAALAAIGAAIAAAYGEGKASVGVKGSFDETTGEADCCKPGDGLSVEERATVAGALSTVATGAIIVAASDAKDPWYRGQEQTLPGAGEITLREDVDMELIYPEAPTAGTPYPVEVKWTYHRYTDRGVYEHSVAETQTNIHELTGPFVDAPATLQAEVDPFVFTAKFGKPDNRNYRGVELYAFALVVSPAGVPFRVPLLDDGLGYDEKAADGLYTGYLDWQTIVRKHYRREHTHGKRLEDLIVGFWKIYVYAQDINDATPEMKPTEAATHIGGMMVASAAKIKLDASLPCPLTADATVQVHP